MSLRRRFDIAITLWAGLTLATFMLGVLLYVDALDLGLDDPAAFDASIIVAAFGLVVLVLRPAFRDLRWDHRCHRNVTSVTAKEAEGV